MKKTKILLIQAVDNVLGANGLVPGFQRDAEHALSRSNSTEGSKMGAVSRYGSLTETISSSFLLKQGDEGQEELRRAIKDGLEVKVWLIDTEKNKNGNYDATFGYTILNDVTYNYPYEGVEEVSAEFTVQGQTVKAELTALPPGVLDFAAYGFETPGEYTGAHDQRTKDEDEEEGQGGGGI